MPRLGKALYFVCLRGLSRVQGHAVVDIYSGKRQESDVNGRSVLNESPSGWVYQSMGDHPYCREAGYKKVVSSTGRYKSGQL